MFKQIICKVLHCNRIDISEGNDVNNISTFICHHWYFLDKRFRFQPAICNWCNDVLTLTVLPS